MVSTRARRKDGRGSLKKADKEAAAATHPKVKSKVKSKAPAAKPAAAAVAGKKAAKKGKGKEKMKKIEVKPKEPTLHATPLVQHNAVFTTATPTAASSFDEIRAIKVVTSSRQSRKAAAAQAATAKEMKEPEANPTGTAEPGLHEGRIVSGRWWKSQHKRYGHLI